MKPELKISKSLAEKITQHDYFVQDRGSAYRHGHGFGKFRAGSHVLRWVVWLDTTCATNADCKGVINTECYAGQCLCTPGYYYSISHNYCVDSCAVSDLQATFLRYPNVAIPSNNLYGGSRPAVQDCLDWCAADTRCLTAEWQGGSGSGYCIAAGVTALDVPKNYWDTTGFQDFDLYQRKCA
nr:hypothetical protein BaRGS_020076 [Batillaria attramentaria]